MTTQVSTNILKSFLVNDLGIRKLNSQQAQEYDIDANDFAEADKDDNGLDINEIVEDADLYEQFATMYVEEREKATASKDEEQEKEEAVKVQDKGESKA